MRYLADTDTLLVSFRDRPIADTRDVNGNVRVGTGEDGHGVGRTVEHVKERDPHVTEFVCPRAPVRRRPRRGGAWRAA